MISDAIARAVDTGKVTTTEAELARLFLDGQIRPNASFADAWHSVVQSTATYLRVSPQALETDLIHGQSLADIAVSHGRSKDGVANVIMRTTTSEFNRAVTAGVMSRPAAQVLLALMRSDLANVLASRL